MDCSTFDRAQSFGVVDSGTCTSDSSLADAICTRTILRIVDAARAARSRKGLLMFRRKRIATALVATCAATTLASADQTTKYAYDALGRLRYVQVTGGTTTGQVEYKYDPSGNRTRYIVSGSTSSGSLTITPFSSNVLQTAIGVTLGVHVAGFPPASGMMTFTEGLTPLGSVYVSNGDASIILEGFSRGTHTVTASYGGDSFNAPYSYTFTITVRDLSWLPSVIELILSD